MHTQLLMRITIKCLGCSETPGKCHRTARDGTIPQDSYQDDEAERESSGLKNKTNSLVHFTFLIISAHIINHTIIEESQEPILL